MGSPCCLVQPFSSFWDAFLSSLHRSFLAFSTQSVSSASGSYSITHTPHQVLNIHPPIRPPTHLPRHLIYLPYYLFILFIYSAIYPAIHLSNLLSIIYSLSQLPIIYLYLPIHSFILPIHLPWSIYVSVHLPTLTIISFIYPSVHLSIHSPTIHQSIFSFICSSDLSTVHQSIHLSTHSVNMH